MPHKERTNGLRQHSPGCRTQVRLRTRPTVLLGCLALLLGPDVVCAQAPPSTASADGALVGKLSHPDLLAFEGNRAFTKDQILEGLSLHLEFHLAAHPAAPMAGYTALLERLVARGYQHAGFPQATVKASANANPVRLLLTVQEGPRYECGGLLLSGAKPMTTDRVRKAIEARLAGGQGGTQSVTNMEATRWRPGGWAPYDGPSQRRLQDLVLSALADLGYFQPKVRVSIAPGAKGSIADLKVEIADEGIQGTVEEIEITGLRANTRQEVLDYLQLKPGMPLAADLTSRVSTQLWSSARFVHQAVDLRPKAEVGKFRLELDLEELRGAAGLSQDLPPEAKAMLRFRDWLAGWSGGAEDFSCKASLHSGWLRLHVEGALSAAAFALASRPEAAGPPGSISYAWIASPELDGFYSATRRRKYSFRSVTHGFRLSIRVDPNNIQINAGAGRARDGRSNLDLDFVPAAFLKAIYRPGAQAVVTNGVLSARYADETEDTRVEFRVDAATGRLFEGVVEGKGWELRLAPQAGAFARLRDEIIAATTDHVNEHAAARPFSAWLMFVASDFIEAPWIDPLLQRWSDQAAEQGTPPAAVTAIRQAKATLTLGRELLGKEHFAKVFEPLNRLSALSSGQDEASFFLVPWGDPAEPSVQSGLEPLAAYALSEADALAPRDSWLWTLFREATFTLSGQGRYTEVELNKLLVSDDVGPAGCLVTAWLLGRVNPKLARTFAQRGLSRLSVAALRQDYRVLLQEKSIPAEVLANVLGSFRSLSQDQATRLTAGLGSGGAALLEQVAQELREHKHSPPADAAWPAFEQQWDKVVKPALQWALTLFLPQVQFLTAPKALYARGLALTDPDALLQDFEEAALCFRKAADLGHGGAQLQLGMLFERGQGVRQDHAEAVRWYRKAVEQNEPHAACQLGVMYEQGLGVDKDLAQAASWLRAEAENGCAGAQFHLGRVCEEQLNMPEALQWYRKAAGNGETPAQARLGDLLSDGFSTTPDYLEACQWLILAAGRAEDRLSEHRLRRAKAKLTAEQLALAEERAAAVTRRLEKNAKERKQK